MNLMHTFQHCSSESDAIEYYLYTVWQESLAVRKFDEFGKSSLIRQTKTIQISTYNYN